MEPSEAGRPAPSRDFLELVVDAIEEPVFVKDRSHRFLLANEAFCRLFGRTAEDIIGRTDRDFATSPECDAFWADDDRAFETGLEVRVEEPYTDSSGRQHIMRTRKHVIRNPLDGEPVLVAVITDITDEFRAKRELEEARDELEREVEARTAELRRANEELVREIEERRRAEETLRRAESDLQGSNEFLEGVVDTVYDPVFIKDENHRWIMLNQAACEFFGYPREVLIGKSDYDFFPREQADVFWEKDRRVIETGVDDVNEEALTDGQGRRHVISTKKSLFVTRGGRRILVGIITDLTAQKEAEEELRAAKEQAETANRAKSIFLANMSHEFRTPLNNLQGLLDLMDLTELTEEQRDYIRMAHLSARELSHLVNDVLDLSAVEAGGKALERVPFDLHEIVTTVHQGFTPAAARKGLKLSCSCPQGEPRLMGDPGRLKQVLGNLVTNAVKFTERGEVGIRVECSTLGENDRQIRFMVTDTGIGIDAALREVVFSPFTQVDSSTTKRYAGTGLGLHIVKVLVERMGGRLGVESELGRGSRFWFEVSLDVARASTPAPVAPPQDRGGANGQRILVAEDNTLTQLLIRALLAKMGYSTVTIVDDGRMAVEAMREGGYDLVLMDIQMPDMDGLEATRLIRAMEDEQGRHTPIVACTAYAFEEDLARCKEAGMDACVTKPIDGRVLIDTVRRWLDSEPGAGP